MRDKCPYSEFFWSVFSCIRTECGEIQSISLFSVQIRGKYGPEKLRIRTYPSLSLLKLERMTVIVQWLEYQIYSSERLWLSFKFGFSMGGRGAYSKEALFRGRLSLYVYTSKIHQSIFDLSL